MTVRTLYFSLKNMKDLQAIFTIFHVGSVEYTSVFLYVNRLVSIVKFVRYPGWSNTLELMYSVEFKRDPSQKNTPLPINIVIYEFFKNIKLWFFFGLKTPFFFVSSCHFVDMFCSKPVTATQSHSLVFPSNTLEIIFNLYLFFKEIVSRYEYFLRFIIKNRYYL
jgi:hypothetical protein